MDFVAVAFSVTAPEKSDLLIGQLTLLGFTGFEEEPGRLTAYVPSDVFGDVQAGLEAVGAATQLPYQIRGVPWQNWNQQWESSFSPVRVGDFCGIRAGFHAPVEGVTHEIVITPKMTFGTGHHATTASMIRLMETLEVRDRAGFDFGTGTGVLAILAARMGASRLVAVDNDAAAVENARENARENGVAERIRFFTADSASAGAVDGNLYDFILANIQLGVISDNLQAMAALLTPGGRLLVSGVLLQDAPRLEAAAGGAGLVRSREIRDGGWIAWELRRRED
jgi:ribosomal protein L11 methyltransferase